MQQLGRDNLDFSEFEQFTQKLELISFHIVIRYQVDFAIGVQASFQSWSWSNSNGLE